MSDYSSMATLQNNSPKAGLAAAVQRAKVVAAKLTSGSTKRPLEEGPEPSSKKLSSVSEVPYQQPSMSAAAAAAAMRLAQQNSGPPSGMPAGLPPNMNMDQALNEFIRVPDEMVGLIIGRGGEQITRLQAESGCKIQMAPPTGGQPDRVCTLTGSREAITRAKELVNQIVNHRGRENAAPGDMTGGGPPINTMPPVQRGGGGGLSTAEEIMLPGPKVGLIIGKNGKTIKQLQEQSGAKMVVIQDGPTTEYEKPLRITGDPSKVEHAKQLVYELLADKDGQSQQGGNRQQGYDDYQPMDQGNNMNNSTEVLVPKVAVGVVIGRGGDMIKKIQAETGCRVQFHQERDEGPGDKRCYLQGKPHQVEQAKTMIEDLISSVNRREKEVRQGRGRSNSAQRNGSERGDYQQWQDTQEVKVTFTVSNVKCGLIIGRGGEVIKQINAQSGAHCELDRRAQNPDRNNRTFYIRGHPEAVDQCKRIIMEKVGMPVNFIGEGGSNGSAEYYAGGNGGGSAPAWGYNPHWHQPQQQPQQQQQQPSQVPLNPATGQLDYSQQWIEYYRSMGMTREAEAIEQQAKQQQMQGIGNGGGGGNGGAPAPAPTAGPAAGQAADYSVQWAEYYRSCGKNKEADAIEAQIKMKQQQQQGGQVGGGPGGPGPGGPGGPGPGNPGGPGPGGAPTPPSPAAPMVPQYPQYPVYNAGQMYPGYNYPYPGSQPDHHQ